MSGSDRQSIVARLWCYISLLPADVSVAYTLRSNLPRGMEAVWVQFLHDMVENRLLEEAVRERYAPFFPDPERAHAKMRALQSAWSDPRMTLLREMMGKDIRALEQSQGTTLVPVEVASGKEGSPA